MTTKETVENLFNDTFKNRVYSVENGAVWVSGMNAGCASTARKMARTLVQAGIPCGLVYDDNATRFGGVQFNYGENA